MYCIYNISLANSTHYLHKKYCKKINNSLYIVKKFHFPAKPNLIYVYGFQFFLTFLDEQVILCKEG